MEVPEGEGLAKTTYLVQEAQNGNRNALNDLFARYAPRVYTIVSLRLGRPRSDFRDLEDIAQDALMNVLSKLDKFVHRSEGSFRCWVSKCVHRSVIDYLRAAKAQKQGGGKVRRFGELEGESLAELLFPGDGPTPSALAKTRESEEEIEVALLGLADHQREILILRFICGMSFKEIAEEMGFAREGTARQACARAVESLRKSLVAMRKPHGA